MHSLAITAIFSEVSP